MIAIIIIIYLILGSAAYGILIAESESHAVIKAILWPFIGIAYLSNKLYAKQKQD
jgi:hypothetical protein